MPTTNPFPLSIGNKSDVWEKLQLLANVDPAYKYTADEWNVILQALNYLYENLGGIPEVDWGEITGNIQDQADLMLLINGKPIENVYENIAAMLADQGNQTEGFLQKATDASADPDIESGKAYYEKKAASTGSLSDYDRLSDSQAQALESVDITQFKVAELTTDPHTSVGPNAVSVRYSNPGDKVVSILFDAIFSAYLVGLKAAAEDYSEPVKFAFTFFNTTSLRGVTFKDVSFELVGGTYMKMVAANSDVEVANFAAGDNVRLYISAYEAGEGGSGEDDYQEGYLDSGTFYEDAGLTTPITPATGILYTDLLTNTFYRWTGSVYIVVSDALSGAEIKTLLFAEADTNNLTDALLAKLNNAIQKPTEGTNGQVLTTDGAGTYTWQDAGGGALVPGLNRLEPISLLPSQTQNLKIYASNIDENTTVAIESQTVNSVALAFDNNDVPYLNCSVTTGATEDDFDVTLNNGTEAVYVGALTVNLGDVFIPKEEQWETLSLLDASDDGQLKLTSFGVVGNGLWEKEFDYTKDFIVRFQIHETPLGNLSETNSQDETLVLQTTGGTKMFYYNLYRNGGNIWFHQTRSNSDTSWVYHTGSGLGTAWSGVYANPLEFRYLSGVMYVYLNGSPVRTFSDSVTSNLKLKLRLEWYDCYSIKYIELP